jgi:hypothetical protein
MMNKLMNKFKPGAHVLATIDCSGNLAGKVYTVDVGGKYLLTESGDLGCGCYSTWERADVIAMGSSLFYTNNLIEAGDPITYLQKHIQKLIDKSNPMMKLSPAFKRVLPENFQKQYKAGLIDESFELTQKGKAFMQSLLQEKYEVELTVEADRILAEYEEQDK